MPELPEVEVTRHSIDAPLRGARVLTCQMGKPLRWSLGCEPAQLQGRVLGAVLRRGKYLWLPLAAGGADVPPEGGLLIHLGMSGSLRVWPRGDLVPERGVHDHFELVTDRGTLRLHDPRRFGAVVWSAGLDQPPAATLLARLGPEPFDPTLDAKAFHQALKGRQAPIKQVLLSGQAVVGAGNIYACEALFRSGIDPRTPAARVGPRRAARLLQAVRDVLSQAIALGGSTLRDFRDAHGMDGAFQSQAAVYGRAGEPCRVCQQPIQRIVQAQRATYFCRHCQRR
jgi:formamidopyrimidine-DNA glycosylase